MSVVGNEVAPPDHALVRPTPGHPVDAEQICKQACPSRAMTMQPLVTENMPSPIAALHQDEGEPHPDGADHWEAAGTDTTPPLAERPSSILSLSQKQSADCYLAKIASFAGWEEQYLVYQKARPLRLVDSTLAGFS